MHQFANQFLDFIYLLASGVQPHTLDLLACVGVATLLLGGLAAVLLACELAKRLLTPVYRWARPRVELRAARDGTWDGMSTRQRARVVEEIVREIKQDH